jgi:hypothetical protein
VSKYAVCFPDCSRGALTFEAVKDYYMRVREHLQGWAAPLDHAALTAESAAGAESTSSGAKRWLWVADTAEDEGRSFPDIARGGGRSSAKGAASRANAGPSSSSPSAGGAPRRGSRQSELSASPREDACDRPIEKLFLYRLLLFVPFLDDCNNGVHLLSALQVCPALPLCIGFIGFVVDCSFCSMDG